MGLVYLFALVVSLGLFLLQAVMGGGDGDAGAAHGADGDADAEHGGGADHGALALLFSTRFWTFFALGFGLSGSLLHYLDLAGAALTAAVAAGSGIAAGMTSALAYRAIKRSEISSMTGVSEAVGRTGRVLISVGPGKKGQVRVELKGQSVDLVAMAEEEELARGEAILIESIEGNVARVSRRPPELE